MHPKKYPLDPLVRLRRDRVDDSVEALSAAIQTREEAERLHVAALAERTRQAEQAQRVRDAEANALGRGEISVADLQRQGAWEARTQWEDQEQALHVARAHEREAAARGGEGEARAGVAKAEADSKVVTKHRTDWAQERERAAEAAVEEGAAEAWRPRR